jgi:hypothetical protein
MAEEKEKETAEKKSWLIPYEILKEYLKKHFKER